MFLSPFLINPWAIQVLIRSSSTLFLPIREEHWEGTIPIVKPQLVTYLLPIISNDFNDYFSEPGLIIPNMPI